MFSIVDIRDCPEYVGVVAVWVHREWWANTSVSLGEVAAWVQNCVASNGLPGILVAVSNGAAIGSIFLHKTEAEDRPAFTPYLGALYVEPHARRQGIGRALVHAVERHAVGLGFGEMYLNAMPHRTSFYEGLGWRIIETGYGEHGLNIMHRILPAP